ncbi:MAG: MBL fold metallo-hydrolase [Gemmatimonadaceae bacterium]|jgi:glyoxylase-like metal-dependent hydrolase (beta-lactamase superfamily II)
MTAPVTIVNVGYRSTNFWVVSAGRQRLLVDLGWWGMFSALSANLDRADIPLREITHGVATHYHGDHAGAAQDLKNAGMRLIVAEEQVAAISLMRRHAKESDRYTEITPDGNLVVSCADSRALLAKLGINGQFVHTPGHSDDSITVLLDSGEAFTGDLTWPMFATDETIEQVMASWERLRTLGARTVYAGHGPVRPMPGA